ncbi:MAG: hypothetical protein SWK76_06800 [Actinomycetota bacterium]|nr:hypothetical protein [Actinomycetota bacterium]
MFESFTRGEEGDTGLGLAIAGKIVDVYGGDIRACSDEGACFEFNLYDYTVD